MANYKVEIKESKGSCATEGFKLLAENGDITANKVTESIGRTFKLTGYALTHITTADKEFDMNYYATTEGILSSGSEVFKDSIEKYYGVFDTFNIVSVKTKKGTTYKAAPVPTTNSIEE